MKYYYYGNDKRNREYPMQGMERREEGHKEWRQGELIIDEDSVYEIDMECVRCRSNGKQR